MSRKLPEFVDPMLAQTARPFDSDLHLFEIKWDGTRAIALIEDDGIRLHNRRRFDLRARYPELECLAALPGGTVLDGEIVVLVDDLPDFEALLSRDRVQDADRSRRLAREHPVTYVVFDLVYRDWVDLCAEPLEARRDWLRELLEAAGQTVAGPVVLSEGVIGPGQEFFRQVAERGLEGVIAKRLDSRYLPGERSDAWTKIKRRERLHCAIIGYLASGSDLRSLVLAADVDGRLRPVGRVGSGLTDRARDELFARLEPLRRDTPLVPCEDDDAVWVEPALYCVVRYVERTRAGQLRAPVFERLVEPDAE